MSAFPIFRIRQFCPLARGMAALMCLLFFTQCETTSNHSHGSSRKKSSRKSSHRSSSRTSSTYKIRKSSGSYKKKNYSAEKLATPPGHGMTKKQYPFDDAGNYRRDWVRNGSSSRTKSSRKGFKTASVKSSTYAAPAPRESYSGPAGNSASRPASTPRPVPATKPAARYHKVVPGDTLYSLSRRYGVSVSALQSTNGLNGNLIRTGQSLRIP